MQIIITGNFDSTRGTTIRFCQEAARLGPVTLYLKSDNDIIKETGKKAQFSEAERRYFTESIRYIDKVVIPAAWLDSALPEEALALAAENRETLWLVPEDEHSEAKKAAADKAQIGYKCIQNSQLEGYVYYPELKDTGRIIRESPKKVVVTGCFDLFHTGHIRFFEEVSDYGQLYVVIGSDKNVALLKGPKRPLFKQDERLFIIDAIRFVKQSLVSSGSGWMDAEPEIGIIKPDIYAVNEDGDVPEKRDFCAKHNLQYLVLKRKPKEGLPARSSTQLREKRAGLES